VDDRLYTVADKAVQEKIAATLNEDEGGKDITPDIDGPEIAPKTSASDKVKTREIAEGDELPASLKLGEFVRVPSQLARAHDFSQTNEPQIGM